METNTIRESKCNKEARTGTGIMLLEFVVCER